MPSPIGFDLSLRQCFACFSQWALLFAAPLSYWLCGAILLLSFCGTNCNLPSISFSFTNSGYRQTWRLIVSIHNLLGLFNLIQDRFSIVRQEHLSVDSFIHFWCHVGKTLRGYQCGLCSRLLVMRSTLVSLMSGSRSSWLSARPFAALKSGVSCHSLGLLLSYGIFMLIVPLLSYSYPQSFRIGMILLWYFNLILAHTISLYC